MNYDRSRDGLAAGCCSAISPCSHQQRDPNSICDNCQKAATVGAAAEERRARWNLDGRFVYRNKHGAVGYVDGEGSNPGLLAVVKCFGEDAEAIATRVHAMLQADSSAAQERTDICQALGCVDKPGEPLKHVLDLIDRKAKAYAREIELLHLRAGGEPRQNDTIAAELEEIAGKASEEAMAESSTDRGLALLKRARTYRKLAEVMRQPGFGEARRG